MFRTDVGQLEGVRAQAAPPSVPRDFDTLKLASGRQIMSTFERAGIDISRGNTKRAREHVILDV